MVQYEGATCHLRNSNDWWHYDIVQIRNWFLITAANMKNDVTLQLKLLKGLTEESFKFVLHKSRNRENPNVERAK